MIDLHAHILPNIDDGADSWNCALAMLQNAEAEGIEAIVATPHILSEHNFKQETKIIQLQQELSSLAKKNGLKIKIFLGSEILLQPDNTLKQEIATINANQKYFLVEFPMTSIPRFVPEKLFEFAVDGKIPIIAHPERNVGFQNRPDFIFEYVQRDCLMQINEGSLRGRFGDRAKKLAFQMLENKLVHVVASDGHKQNTRTVTLAESYKLVQERFGQETARRLFYDNPKKIIFGEKIDIGEPKPLGSEDKHKFWERLKFFLRSN